MGRRKIPNFCGYTNSCMSLGPLTAALSVLLLYLWFMAVQRILMIDDDEDDQQIFCMAVARISPDADCICLNGAEVAIEQLKAKTVRPELIFLDLNMPIMNGHDFLALAQTDEDLKSIPVIILSTSSDPHTIESCKQKGAMDFVVKPGSFNKLVDILTPIIQ
jgi:CheY-like chemotaxis protein